MKGLELQFLVDEKSKRLVTFRRVVAGNWLLITYDGTRPSQMFRADLTFDPGTLRSPFDRSFSYGHPGWLFIEF